MICDRSRQQKNGQDGGFPHTRLEKSYMHPTTYRQMKLMKLTQGEKKASSVLATLWGQLICLGEGKEYTTPHSLRACVLQSKPGTIKEDQIPGTDINLSSYWIWMPREPHMAFSIRQISELLFVEGSFYQDSAADSLSLPANFPL